MNKASTSKRRILDLEKREMRFRNESAEELVNCLFCQQMLPKNYEEIQAHVDAVHKEKKAENVGGGGGGGGASAAANTDPSRMKGEKTLRKPRRKRLREDGADDAENEVDAALRTSQPPNRYFCQICSRGFNFPHRLVGHMELVHRRFDVGDDKHTCDICQRDFQFARLVENHLHSHHSGFLYSCLACSAAFSVAQVRRASDFLFC